MANNWKGYFFRIPNGAIFPMNFIIEGGYKATPNNREEIKAYRDENSRNLTRITAKGKKSSYQVTTRPKLHLEEVIAIQQFFTANESDTDQRKIRLTYWNDEEYKYKTSDFYRPNMEFNVISATPTDIIYNGLTIDLIEY